MMNRILTVRDDMYAHLVSDAGVQGMSIGSWLEVNRESSTLMAQQLAALERRHAEGYERHPVAPGEFDDWEDEQAWEE